MSKKIWCRRCKSLEMHDSRSQRQIQKKDRALKEIIDECQARIDTYSIHSEFATTIYELAEEGMKK